MAFLLLVAGYMTTVNLIASGMRRCSPTRPSWTGCGRSRAAAGGAVEELLRYDGPVSHAHVRFAAEPVDLGGVRIRAGRPC